MLGIRYSDEVDLLSEINNVANSIRHKMVNKVDISTIIRPTIMIGLVLYLLLLFGGLGTANLDGYRITTHTISRLGSLEVTRLPFLFDFSSIVGGATTIIFYYYLFQRLNHQLPQKQNYVNHLLHYSMILGILGSLGIIFVGIFSVDRECGKCHIISSVIAFGGFTLSLLLFGLIIVYFDTTIPKALGIPGLLPTLAFILQCIFATPLGEWILLLSIIFALIPLFLWLIFYKNFYKNLV